MNNILESAKKFLGVPYVWGGESLAEGGFDCSGFIYNVLNESGVKVPRDTAQGYYNRFKNRECNLNTPGALIFYGKSKNNITHVAINIDGIHMYESRGTKSNTKNKPGKGVVVSLITRRKDLVAICDPTPKVKPIIPEPVPNIKRGDMGVNVNRLQTCLNYFGYGIKVDGIFGPRTFEALCDYQNMRYLKVDGIFGPLTYAKMRGEINGN